MSATRLISWCLPIGVFVLTVGCDSKPQPDPLVGWKKWGKDTGYPLDKAIVEDYEAYIKTLPQWEKEHAQSGYNQFFCEDGTGQHAVEVGIPVNGTWWKHVLIYDRTNKRMRVIKYRSGRYSC
jgi:hypothetical protein